MCRPTGSGLAPPNCPIGCSAAAGKLSAAGACMGETEGMMVYPPPVMKNWGGWRAVMGMRWGGLASILLLLFKCGWNGL